MRVLACFLLAVCSLSALAAPAVTDKRPILQLEASASREVLEDTAHATLFVEKEDEDAVTAQRQVTEILSIALVRAKAMNGISVKTGQTSTYAVYDKDRRIQAWRVRSELVLESRNPAALSQCVTTLAKTMSIESMGFSLSVASRRKVQETLQGEAIAAFRAKAKAAASQFGYKRYALSEARIAANGGNVPLYGRVSTLRAKSATEAVPMEAGKTIVTIMVSGSVRLEK